MLYNIVLFLFRIYYSLFYKRSCVNADFVPATGKVIIASNHRYFNDPFFLALCIKRPIYFLAKKELFNNAFKKWIMEHLNCIPVSRDGNDLYSLKKSLGVLKSGDILCIFPEGTRNTGNKDLIRLKPGIAAIAIRSKAPIIPAYIENDYKYFGKINVYFGKPFELSEYYDKKLLNEDYERIANTVIAEKILLTKAESKDNI